MDGYPWISVDVHGYPWISMDIHACLFISMNMYGYPDDINIFYFLRETITQICCLSLSLSLSLSLGITLCNHSTGGRGEALQFSSSLTITMSSQHDYIWEMTRPFLTLLYSPGKNGEATNLARLEHIQPEMLETYQEQISGTIAKIRQNKHSKLINHMFFSDLQFPGMPSFFRLSSKIAFRRSC